MKRLFSLVVFFGLLCLLSFFSTQKAFAGTPVATQSSLLATTPGSNSVPADGVTMASVTATLKDATGSAVAGDVIQLAAPADPNIKFQPTSVALNAQGIATFSATSTTVGTDSINVTDLTSSTTLTALGTITFTQVLTPTPTPTTAPTPTPTPIQLASCTSAAPGAPNLYAVITSGTSAKLYFVQPPNPFNGFTISYGLTSSADTFAVNFNQGSSTGAITYTVNSLLWDETYYFKVRALNGCQPGAWSQTLSSLIGSSSSGSASLLPNAGSNIVPLAISLGGISAMVGLALIVFF